MSSELVAPVAVAPVGARSNGASGLDAQLAAPRRRHFLRWLLLGVAFVVIAGVAVAFFASWTYQPIKSGGTGGAAGYQDGTGLVSIRSDSSNAYQLSSGPFEGKLGISLVNTGRWGVTIESVTGPSVVGFPSSTTCVQGTNIDNYSSSPCLPFRPFGLSAAGRSGDWRFLVLTLHFGCVPLFKNESIVIDNLNVTYRYLGFDHKINLADSSPLTLVGPNRCAT